MALPAELASISGTPAPKANDEAAIKTTAYPTIRIIKNTPRERLAALLRKSTRENPILPGELYVPIRHAWFRHANAIRSAVFGPPDLKKYQGIFFSLNKIRTGIIGSTIRGFQFTKTVSERGWYVHQPRRTIRSKHYFPLRRARNTIKPPPKRAMALPAELASISGTLAGTAMANDAVARKTTAYPNKRII